MNVYVEKTTEQQRWWVRMDHWRVSFSTAADAEQFVERLTSRLNAPHSFDLLAGGASNARIDSRAQCDRRRAKEA